MPLNKKGKEIMKKMKEEYGDEEGEEIFWKSRSKGTITGVDPETSHGRRKGKTGKARWGWED
jgi:hypothetical protein